MDWPTVSENVMPKNDIARRVPRAWYQASIQDFLGISEEEVLGVLTTNNDFTLLPTQRDAWRVEIEFLKQQLTGLSGAVFLEFNIPRMGRRVDVILLINSVVFVVEFKVGEITVNRSAIDQVWDYALDLKNFHEASHSMAVVPILIATEVVDTTENFVRIDQDGVYQPIAVTRSNFRKTIDDILGKLTTASLDAHSWVSASYRPTPTIIEAARSLYARHSVEAIARHDAGAKNLTTTSQCVEALINRARSEKRKLICFVTGVPGAGKTLVGLNIATHRHEETDPSHAVFLSGNGPLVAVLREALTRDEYFRQRGEGRRVRKGEIHERVKAFIQNIHHFRDEALIDDLPPSERVVIFDEAQRAWNLRQTAHFMQRKKGYANFSQSEPEFLISYMDRHEDWAVVVCLVGGGQEINTGEAGISAWIEAVREKFPHWQMYISSRLTDSEYAAGHVLETVRQHKEAFYEDGLHLAVSMRSFRSENVSYFVKMLLDCERDEAQKMLKQQIENYPIVVTRCLDRAKSWVRQNARGSERCGLLASSRAQRLKPYAIDVRADIDPVHWFLDDRNDTRSSFYLEDAATEFHVQGLELDWACVTWDGDFRKTENGWGHHDFRGSRWCNISNEDNRNYLRNAYRVLLTRARQGMVIFVPEGDVADGTRNPVYYDGTFNYLVDIGVPVLS